MYSDIMRISRLRMASDGTGVSTLVAFWGCPLHCKYCINDQCHDRGNEYPEVERAAYTPQELVEILSKDDLYYKMTGGGIVFGGGEPLVQAAFVHEVCELADPKWAKRIETSLYAHWKDFYFLTDDIDEWIIDIKDMNKEIYKAYTGRSNRCVVQNLKKLIERVPPERIWIRVPHIPGFNEYEDVERSIKELRKMGFVHTEEFGYEFSQFVKKPDNYRRLQIPGYLMKKPELERKADNEKSAIKIC